MGAGFTGLADALAMLGVKYGSDEANIYVDQIMYIYSKAIYRASIEYAKKFPNIAIKGLVMSF